MKKFKKSVIQFIAILLLMAMTFGLGYSVLAVPEEADTTEEQTDVVEDDIGISQAEEPDTVEKFTASVDEEPDTVDETAAPEEQDEADENTYGDDPDPTATPEIQPGEEDPEDGDSEEEAGDAEEEPAYDPQPTTMEEVQVAIDAYEAEYQAVLEAYGVFVALEVPKPHWQYEVPAELMPSGYNCQLVDWGEEFCAEYYTFFPNPVAMATGYGTGDFVNPPPSGPDIRTVFDKFVGNTLLDTVYPNIAIATLDKTNQFGAMWASTKLDLSLPFSTEMYIHLGHSANPANSLTVADGMTFTMHNYAQALTSMIGGRGEGLGVYRGRNSSGNEDGRYLPNSLVIEFDTYNNFDQWSYVADPTSSGYNAHCSLIIPTKNGSTSTTSPYTSAFPNRTDHDANTTTIYFNSSQQWVLFKVTWTPSYSGSTLGGTLTYTFAGETRSYYIADVTSVFGGTSVWWGFTGATGSQTAVQAAAIAKLPEQEYDVVKTVEDSDESNIDGGTAKAGDTITYTIRVESPAAFSSIGIGPIKITDQLSALLDLDTISGIKMVTGTSGGTVTGTSTIPDGQVDITDSILAVETNHILGNTGDWLEISFTVKIKGDAAAGSIVYNTATVHSNVLADKVSNTTEVTIVASSSKRVAGNSAAGVGGEAVTVGNEITYEITYINNTGSVANLTITDALPDGVEYVTGSASDDGVYDEINNEVVWEISNVASGASGSVTFKVKVTKDIDKDQDLINKAVLEWSNGTTEKPSVKNPVEGYKVTYHGNGGANTQGDEYAEGLFPLGDDYTVLGNDVVGFERDGYVFVGWNTEDDGSGESYAPEYVFEDVTEDIDLYAQWEEITTIPLTLFKVDAKDYTTPLSGAEFDLYRCTNTEEGHVHTELADTDSCWAYVASAESLAEAGKEGLIEFSVLLNSTYLLVETKAPSGYELPKGQWQITVSGAGAITINAVGDPPAFQGGGTVENPYLVGNIKQYELPVMGGAGTFWFAVLGGVLLTGGTLLLLGYRRLGKKYYKKTEEE